MGKQMFYTAYNNDNIDSTKELTVPQKYGLDVAFDNLFQARTPFAWPQNRDMANHLRNRIKATKNYNCYT